MLWRIDERRAHLSILALQTLLCMVFVVATPIFGLSTAMLVGALVGLLTYAGLASAYWQGMAWSRVATVAVTTLIVAVSIGLDAHSRSEFTPVFFVPLVFALIFVGPVGILATGGAMLVALLVVIPAPNPYVEPLRLAVIVVLTIGMALARAVHDTMRERAEVAAKAARVAQGAAEVEAARASAQATELAARSEEQQRLLNLVADLETPAVTLSAGVLLAPLIGALDSRRLTSLSERLYRRVSEQRAQLLVLDLTGVSLLDTQAARSLERLVTGVRLLGCQVTITGISAEVARTLTHLGAGLDGVATARSPQEALGAYKQL